MKRKKRKNNLLKSMFFIVIGLIFINLIYSLLILEVVRFDMHLNVENRVGFNITVGLNGTNIVEFGTIPPGGEGYKEIFIENKDYKKTKVVIKAYGGLKDWVIVSENKFIMKKNDIRKIKVEVYVPYNARYKQYYGRLKIMFLRF